MKNTLNTHQSGYINVILGQRFSLLETCEKGGCTQSRLNSISVTETWAEQKKGGVGWFSNYQQLAGILLVPSEAQAKGVHYVAGIESPFQFELANDAMFALQLISANQQINSSHHQCSLGQAIWICLIFFSHSELQSKQSVENVLK